jgi:hypothetical protein
MRGLFKFNGAVITGYRRERVASIPAAGVPPVGLFGSRGVIAAAELREQ